MTMSRPDSTASPLTVKEQFEASATRFWSSMRNLNIEETMKAKNHQEQSSQSASSHETQEANTVQAVSFQSVIHAVFGSCTTGASYEGFQKARSLSVGSSSSHVFSRDGGSAEPHSKQIFPLGFGGSAGNERPKIRRAFSKTQGTTPPVGPRTKFFQDNRERAEEAVLHLREQQLQQQQDLEHQQQQHQRQKEYERIVSNRALQSKSLQHKTEGTPQESPNLPSKEHPSFFPASKPTTGRDPPGALRTTTNPAVPKEVSSPARRGCARENGVPAVATAYQTKDSGPDDDIFDFDGDGVSVITQETVDEMMRQLELQQKDFPNNFLLYRVYSDDTDPVDQSFGHLNKGSTRGEVSIDELNNFLSEGRYMSPPRLTRQNRSSETRSLFTKTTNSSHSDDFSAWKEEEQRYWNSQVAKDESTETGVDSIPKNFKSSSRSHGPGGVKGSLSATQPSLRSRKLQRVREKVKRNVVLLNAASVKGEHEALPPVDIVAEDWKDDQFLDGMVIHSDTDVAEI